MEELKLIKQDLIDLETRVNEKLANLLDSNHGMRFISDEDSEAFEFGEMLEYRNEFSGTVHDFHAHSITSDGQIKGLNTDGTTIGPDHVNMRQLDIESKLSLIEIILDKIEETK